MWGGEADVKDISMGYLKGNGWHVNGIQCVKIKHACHSVLVTHPPIS